MKTVRNLSKYTNESLKGNCELIKQLSDFLMQEVFCMFLKMSENKNIKGQKNDLDSGNSRQISSKSWKVPLWFL